MIITTCVAAVDWKLTNFNIFRIEGTRKDADKGLYVTVSDLVQIDGAVIAGVLVFLTFGTSIQIVYQGIHLETILVAVTTACIVIPFALSAMRVATKGLDDTGIKLTNAGFIYLIVSVILLAFLL